jgi:hypothetical protein
MVLAHQRSPTDAGVAGLVDDGAVATVVVGGARMIIVVDAPLTGIPGMCAGACRDAPEIAGR